MPVARLEGQKYGETNMNRNDFIRYTAQLCVRRKSRQTALAVANAEGCVYVVVVFMFFFVRRRRSIAVALGAARFMLAPCSNERDPYGAAAGAVRSVVRQIKEMRAAACIKVVAPVGTDLDAISDRKRKMFKAQVRVRVQLGTFPEVVTIKVANDVAIQVGADLAIRDHLTIELTTAALTAIRKMAQALQRSPHPHPPHTLFAWLSG